MISFVDTNLLSILKSIFIILSFFILFFIFIGDKYPLHLSKKTSYISIFILLIIIHATNIAYFFLDSPITYFDIYQLMLSILTFALMIFIFRV